MSQSQEFNADQSATPRRPSQIEVAIGTLSENVQRLNMVLKKFEEKFEPVLRGKTLADQGDIAVGRIETKDAEDKVGLARAIHVQVTNIIGMAVEMEGMINRAEV